MREKEEVCVRMWSIEKGGGQTLVRERKEESKRKGVPVCCLEKRLGK